MTMGFGYMEATEGLDKSSFSTEVGTKSRTGFCVRGTGGKGSGNEYSVEKVKIVFFLESKQTKTKTQTQ